MPGKSSLFRILVGLDTPDSGAVTYNKEVRLGFLSQHEELDDNKTILESKAKAIYLSKLFLLLIAIVCISLLVFFIPFLSKDKALFFLSIPIIIGQFINPQWFFQGVENFKWISIVNVVSKVIYILLVLFFIKEKTDYVYANLFFGIGAIIGNSIGLIWLINKYNFNLRNFSTTDAIGILRTEFSFSISQFFLSMYQFFPIIIISYIGGDFMAGQFRIIDQIITIFKTYLNMFFYFVYANICFELNKSLKNGIKIWKQYNGTNFILLFVLLLLFYVFSDYVFVYFKIEESRIPQMSSYFKLGLIVPLLVSISQPLRQLMFAFNENKIYIKITIIATVLNFVLLSFLTKQNGLIGAFISIILIEFIIIVLYLTILKKYFKENSTNEL